MKFSTIIIVFIFSILISSSNCDAQNATYKAIETSSKVEFNRSKTDPIEDLSSNLPLTPQTALYDGLTKYVAREFRTGATNIYMDLFKKHLDKIGELKALFPETYDMLSKRDPFTFPDLGDEWKVHFEKDLREMAKNLVNLIDQNDCSDCLYFKKGSNFNNSPVFKHLSTGVDIADKIIEGYHPINLFEYLDLEYYHNKKNSLSEFGDIVHILNLVQHNLRILESAPVNGQVQNIWFNLDIYKSFEEKQWLKFIDEIRNQDPAFFDSHFSTFKGEGKKFFNEIILPIYSVLIEVQEFARKNSEEKKDFVKLAELILETLNSIDIPSIQKVNLNELFSSIENALDIYVDIKNQKYSAVIPNLIELINKFGPSSTTDVQVNQLSKILFGLNKFGQFAAAITAANNSDDMEEVIRQFVAPPESYTKKRNSKWGLALNAHAGLYASQEKFDGNNYNFAPNFGLTLPVGIELYASIPKRIKSGSKLHYSGSMHSVNKISKDKTKTKSLSGFSHSVFFQALDLGAVLNYRLSNDSETSLPTNVSFRDVFSPGITYNLGLRNSPITLGFGYQYTAKLRSFQDEQDNFIEETPNAHRLLLRVSWDIPLFNIYNRSLVRSNIRKNG